ncbi:hypothetical protein DY000_02025068 [Brassica cretica]|uniref:Uncharacterized protein n=1 Tax=Brassica cretica TaxID=69181 RepID=A0ABQ7ENB2_BRACR|nr:hypothetical protein DY000_02025068 [Brassica cretica]
MLLESKASVTSGACALPPPSEGFSSHSPCFASSSTSVYPSDMSTPSGEIAPPAKASRAGSGGSLWVPRCTRRRHVVAIPGLLLQFRSSPPIVMRALEISLLEGALLGGGYRCVPVLLPLGAWRSDELKHGVVVYGPFVTVGRIFFSSLKFLSDSRLLATGATTGVLKLTAFRFSIAASGEDSVSSGCLRFAGFLGGPKSHLELVAVAVSGPSSCLFSGLRRERRLSWGWRFPQMVISVFDLLSLGQ